MFGRIKIKTMRTGTIKAGHHREGQKVKIIHGKYSTAGIYVLLVKRKREFHAF
jgi:hypothetical protein